MTWQFAQVPSAHSTSNYKIVAGSDVSEFGSSGFFIELFLCSADEYWRRSEFVGAFFAMRNREFLQQGSKPGRRTTVYQFIGMPKRSPPDWCAARSRNEKICQ
jgi:hypothetical protein